MERSLVQILELVAIRNVRHISAEVANGSARIVVSRG